MEGNENETGYEKENQEISLAANDGQSQDNVIGE